MSVTFENGVIRLTDECSIEEAETLTGLIVEYPTAPIDLSQCRLAHGAVIQVLLSFLPELMGAFDDPFLQSVRFDAQPQ
jgi:hypothetical protein